MTITLDVASQLIITLFSVALFLLGVRAYLKTHNLINLGDGIAGLYMVALYLILLWHTWNGVNPTAWRFAVRMGYFILIIQIIARHIENRKLKNGA